MEYSRNFAASMVLGSALCCVAQAPANHQPVAHETAAPASVIAAKIAIIVFQEAVSQTNEFQREYSELQKKYDPKREQLKTLSDQIDTLTKQVQAQSASLSDAERAARARDIDERKKQLDRAIQDAQGDYQSDMQELSDRIASKVGETMIDYAQKHGYSLVLDAAHEQQMPTVLYWLPSSDITKAVTEAYNEKSGAPARPVTATPEASKPSATR